MIVKVLRPFESLNRVLKVGQLIDEGKEAWRNTRLLIDQRYIEEYLGTEGPEIPIINFGLDKMPEPVKTIETEKTEPKAPQRGRPRNVSTVTTN